MSGTFPSGIYPRSVELRSVSPTRVTVTHSMKRRTRSTGVQRWSMDLVFPPMQRAKYAALTAFLIDQAGQYDSFSYPAPHPFNTPRGTALGTPLVDGAAATGTTLPTKGWTASQTGVMLAGDLLTVFGHSKVYMVTADADSDGTGLASLSIRPALMATPADGAAITVSAVTFNVALVSDTYKLPLRTADLSPSVTISLIEDV